MEQQTKASLRRFLEKVKKGINIFEIQKSNDMNSLISIRKRFPGLEKEIENRMACIMEEKKPIIKSKDDIKMGFIILENTSIQSKARRIIEVEVNLALKKITSLFRLLRLFNEPYVNPNSISGVLLKNRSLEVLENIGKDEIKNILVPVAGQDIVNLPQFILSPMKFKIKELLEE